MRLTLICIGKLKEYLRPAEADYARRLTSHAKLRIIELPEAATPAAEAAKILRAIEAGAFTIALDLKGRQFSSEDFAKYFHDLAVNGTSHINFIIGGAEGLHPDVLAQSRLRLSLGLMTFPHQIARIILLEQVYRAFKLIRNEPYHK